MPDIFCCKDENIVLQCEEAQMFGHHKDHVEATSAKTPSQQEVAHQFDQTNGVMKAFDEYQARMSGQSIDMPDAHLRGKVDKTAIRGAAVLSTQRP